MNSICSCSWRLAPARFSRARPCINTCIGVSTVASTERWMYGARTYVGSSATAATPKKSAPSGDTDTSSYPTHGDAMARHFLQLYVLIVVTLAAVSWGQERLWEFY